MSRIGHNNGPTMEPGQAWRTHCWSKARQDLLPTLPLEIVRLRVKRAQELGLQYRTYATVRAITGRDIVGFLFSSNALGMHRAATPPSPAIATHLSAIQSCQRLAAAHRPLTPEAVLGALSDAGVTFDGAMVAPHLSQSWRETGDALRGAIGALHPASVLVVGETPLERQWAEAGRLAGYVQTQDYFVT